jgi:hypothetical protein
MTPLDLNAIYNLIPSVYRIRDTELALESGINLDSADAARLKALLENLVGLTPLEQQELSALQEKQGRGPLKSLIAILAEQVEVLQESLYQSYDDLFIETCQEWVVPYIGDLVGVKGLADFPGTPYSLRAAVADTIANRRRKGTVSGLERLARDVTGWPSHVVEYFELLATTQYMNHIRPANFSWADVRNADWNLPNTPFDPNTHTADVRNIDGGGGLYNIPNIGIWLWRLEAFHLEDAPAYRVDDHRFTFDALGRDTQLFTLPQPIDPVSGRSTPLNVPMPITRRMFYKNPSSYYGHDLSFFIDQSNIATPSGEWPVRACNLTGWVHQPADFIAVDPELGRIALPPTVSAQSLLVRYTYAFSAELGGGPYSRPFDDTADVTLTIPAEFATIQGALTEAAGQYAAGVKSIAILVSSNNYFVETPTITLPDGASLEIRAADGFRPVWVLSGDLNISGGETSTLAINGWLIAGGCLAVQFLKTLTVAHCTLAPMATPAIGTAPAQPMEARISVARGDLVLDHSITGPLRINANSAVNIQSSIIDAGSQTEIAYGDENAAGSGGPLTVINSTFIGQVHARQIPLASNVIFLSALHTIDLWTAPVSADQLQQGCVRFSYVPQGSRVPRPYRCYSGPLSPAFTSLRFGDPGYCQLTHRSGTAILQGADDQSEMGVFHDLHQPQRIANLRVTIADYLRAGLEAGILFAT